LSFRTIAAAIDALAIRGEATAIPRMTVSYELLEGAGAGLAHDGD
jgi:hypothetical protein